MQESLLTPSIAGQLIQAREKKKLSQSDLADQLRLPLSVIKNIETDYYQPEHMNVFVKGYIRSYAKQVGVPSKDVEAFFLTLGVSSKQVLPTEAKFNFDISARQKKSIRFSTAAIITILVVLVVIWIAWQHESSMPSRFSVNQSPAMMSLPSAQVASHTALNPSRASDVSKPETPPVTSQTQ